MVHVPVKSGFPVNVATGPVVATLSPGSTVPLMELIDGGPWLFTVTPSEFVNMVVSDPRASVVVALGHPTSNEVVTLTFPQTCELKFAAASDKSADNQGCLPRNMRTHLV